MAKWLVMGDLHFGEKGDSQKYNLDLLNLTDWVIKNYKDKVDGVIQLGDFFHHRTKIRIDTLNYGITCAMRLAEAFGSDNVYVLAGNHDLYYDDRLDVSSVSALSPYCNVIDRDTLVGQILLCPWVVSEEHYDSIVNMAGKAKYLFGHFEFNGFKMNDYYVMEHGSSHRALKNFDLVVSGHYHSYQKKDNVVYLGTPLPIDMNQANEDHYVMIFDDSDGSYELVVYDAVKVISVSYEKFVEIADTLDPANTTIRIEFPDDLEDESLIDEFRETIKDMDFVDYKIQYKGSKAKQLLEADVGEISNIENIDESVIKTIQSSAPIVGINKNLLLDLYNQARILGKDQTNE